ncbi:hypothetical protein [Flavisolibacter ginsenosidimutans]|uniref:Uncharacterized protein n=1 Tax=Flavisolibacter ginsenosidimutans TaxID=661481 RepID=A0A5B8UK84_9BACT|nr:hypothetical protein [Flavisolibacter ginsenosidimutans]QEC57107.1 hypothetical protein FSB75_14745 [Flavisolibacter ginsenosidimutans]
MRFERDNFRFIKRAYKLYFLLQGFQIVLVFVCGPHSCEWGNAVYFSFGVAALTLSFLLPLLQKDWPRRKRILFGFLFLLGSVVLWCAGFLLGEFRIVCRLF